MVIPPEKCVRLLINPSMAASILLAVDDFNKKSFTHVYADKIRFCFMREQQGMACVSRLFAHCGNRLRRVKQGLDDYLDRAAGQGRKSALTERSNCVPRSAKR